MTCFQLLSYAYSDDTTSSRPLRSMYCWLWLYVGILGNQALHCSVRRVTRVEFGCYCLNFQKSFGVAWSYLMPWRRHWLWDIHARMCSMHLSVNLSCLTTFDTTELTPRWSFFDRISTWNLRVSSCDTVRIWSSAPILLCCSWSVIGMLHTQSWDYLRPTVFARSAAYGFYLCSCLDWVAEFHTCDVDWLALCVDCQELLGWHVRLTLGDTGTFMVW
jgi:hypothetical protein